jgi:hypothetical protein
MSCWTSLSRMEANLGAVAGKGTTGTDLDGKRILLRLERGDSCLDEGQRLVCPHSVTELRRTPQSATPQEGRSCVDVMGLLESVLGAMGDDGGTSGL